MPTFRQAIILAVKLIVTNFFDDNGITQFIDDNNITAFTDDLGQ